MTSFSVPAGMLAGNIGNRPVGRQSDSKRASGTPIQPVLPSGYPTPKAVTRETTEGHQCPGDGGIGTKMPELVN